MRSETLQAIAGYVAGGAVVSAAELVVEPPRQPRSPLLPPGPVIGMVWTALFACLGVARGRLRGRAREQRALDGLWLLCVTYPLYTGGMRWRGATYAGNAAVFTAAATVAGRIARVRPDAARYVLPILPWAAWATLGLLTERRR